MFWNIGTNHLLSRLKWCLFFNDAHNTIKPKQSWRPTFDKYFISLSKKSKIFYQSNTQPQDYKGIVYIFDNLYQL